MAPISPTAATVPIPPSLRHPADPSSSTHPPFPSSDQVEGERLSKDVFMGGEHAGTPGGADTPRSAVISVPPGWADSPTGGSSRVSRTSLDTDAEAEAEDDPGLTPGGYPLSASSSSSSSNPIFTWPASYGQPSPTHARTHPSERVDPFDKTDSFGDDPFRRSSSSSEDEGPGGSGTKRSMAGSLDTTSSFDNFDLSGVATLPPAPPPMDPLAEERRGSITLIPMQPRTATDPVMGNGQPPVDPEFTSLLGPSESEEFNFDTTPGAPSPPAFNRTFSAPLPNRVGYLRHPLSPLTDPLQSFSAHPHPPISQSIHGAFTPVTARPAVRAFDSNSSTTTKAESESTPSPEFLQTPLQTFSMELADSLQAAIQTLLHLSPPHLLDNAKEQYSGCTVQMPSTSLSALLTSMKSLNYLSANVETLASGLVENGSEEKQDEGILTKGMRRSDDFDIGELVQNVADLLSGQASQKGVDLVLFHGDVGIKHVSVSGDPEGLAYCLSHIMRQILVVANKGDTIELGLQILPQSPSMTPRVSLPLTAEDVDRQRGSRKDSSARSASPGRTLLAPTGHIGDGPVLCVFEIVHNIAQTVDSAAATPRAEMNPFTKLSEQQHATVPKLDTILCRRLLLHQNASLKVDAQPSSPLGSGLPRRAYELSVLLPRGKPLSEPVALTAEEEAVRQPFTSMKLAREPTLEELSSFAESLRGKKVALHANLTSVFARHLTSYLAAWGMDISHIPIEDEPGSPEVPIRPSPPTRQATISTEMSSEIESIAKEQPSPTKTTEKFIIIDDDVTVLRKELIRLRIENNPLSIKPRLTKRPTLNARTRSTPHVRQTSVVKPGLGTVLIHFTSLARYNQVRDVVSSFLGAPSVAVGGTFIHPEVIVIPKPVGPRRFLTALHTAVHQPVVDPFFSPIATSPRSPGGASFGSVIRTPSGGELPGGGFFDSVIEETSDGEHPRTVSDGGSQKAKSPLGEFPPAQASVVRTREGLHLSLPTPGDIMATPAAEYFSTTGTMRSSGSSSAVVMSSPDGRPFGMFFEPPVKSERRSSIPRIPSNIRRMSSRKTSNASTTTLDDNVTSSVTTSPASGKRPSVISENGEPIPSATSSRRSSGRAEPLAEGGSVRSNGGSRRKTLPTNGMEPIIAKGRERSSTITQGSLRRKNGSTGASPIIPSPKEEDVPAFPSRPSTKKLPNTAAIVAAVQEETKRIRAEVARDVAEGTREITEAAKAVAPKKVKEDVVVPPINVLVVEDNPINQNILSMFLRKKKIKHQTAKDGLEAVEKWRTGGFHLILMDIQLPVMDGIEATKEIRKMERSNNIGVFPQTPVSEHHRTLSNAALPTDETPGTAVPSSPFRSSVIIVALTASSLQSDRVVALAAGCNDFLTKPVSLKWLERKIVEWGCMQALIDFDGWRRWKSTDSKDETKRGFQTGPQAAAKSIAGRLRIDRKPARSNTAASTASLRTDSGMSDGTHPPASSSLAAPELIVRTATPDQLPPDPPMDSPTLDLGRTVSQTIAAESLQAAREDLQENKMLSAIALDPPPEAVRQTPPALHAIAELSRRDSMPIDDFTPATSRESTEEHVKVPAELRPDA